MPKQGRKREKKWERKQVAEREREDDKDVVALVGAGEICLPVRAHLL